MENDNGSLREDLDSTIRELSDSYEELSLLYRLSETFAGLDVEEICSAIVHEATSSVNAETASVMFPDEGMERLSTQNCTGKWDSAFTLFREDSVLWRALARRKSIGIFNPGKSNLAGIPGRLTSVLVSPMVGKKRVIGLLVVGDKKDGKEFYSNDIKLINAIARQAALFIENAMLSREMENFLLGTIRSFVKALEASSLWTAGHTERVTEYALAIGREMKMNSEMLERLKICGLLHDIGKIATPKEILNKASTLDVDEWAEIRRHPEIGAGILEGLEKFTDVVECIKYHHEHFDGKNGLHGLKGEDIPLPSRILAVADAFDAMTSDRPYRKRKSFREAVEEIEMMSGTQFDPRVVKSFKAWYEREKYNYFTTDDIQPV